MKSAGFYFIPRISTLFPILCFMHIAEYWLGVVSVKINDNCRVLIVHGARPPWGTEVLGERNVYV